MIKSGVFPSQVDQLVTKNFFDIIKIIRTKNTHRSL